MAKNKQVGSIIVHTFAVTGVASVLATTVMGTLWPVVGWCGGLVMLNAFGRLVDKHDRK